MKHSTIVDYLLTCILLGTDLALIELLLEFLPTYGVATSVLTGNTSFAV